MVAFMSEVLASSLRIIKKNIYIHRLFLESTPFFFFLRYHLQESFPVLELFAIQFGDHLLSRDYLQAGIVIGPSLHKTSHC